MTFGSAGALKEPKIPPKHHELAIPILLGK